MTYVLGKVFPTAGPEPSKAIVSSWEAGTMDGLALTSSSSEVNKGRRALPLAMHATRSCDVISLLLRKGILGTYPFAVPKIQARYIREGDLFVMDH